MIYAVAIRSTLDDGTGDGLVPGAPDKEQIEKLRKLVEETQATVIIHDPLANSEFGVKAVLNWLYDNGVPFDEIWMGFGKPFADFYIDNRSEKL